MSSIHRLIICYDKWTYWSLTCYQLSSVGGRSSLEIVTLPDFAKCVLVYRSLAVKCELCWICREDRCLRLVWNIRMLVLASVERVLTLHILLQRRREHNCTQRRPCNCLSFHTFSGHSPPAPIKCLRSSQGMSFPLTQHNTEWDPNTSHSTVS